jgi:hypothetical protein
MITTSSYIVMTRRALSSHKDSLSGYMQDQMMLPLMLSEDGHLAVVSMMGFGTLFGVA